MKNILLLANETMKILLQCLISAFSYVLVCAWSVLSRQMHTLILIRKNDLFLSGSYICQADPDQLCGDLSLIPTFSRKCGLQSESHSHENNDEPTRPMLSLYLNIK